MVNPTNEQKNQAVLGSVVVTADQCQSGALIVQPGVARNAIQMMNAPTPRATRGVKPYVIPLRTDGRRVSLNEIVSFLWFRNQPERKIGYLNTYLSAASNRRGFVKYPPDFSSCEGVYRKDLFDFYTLAFQHIHELTEDSICNFICHKKNPHRDEALKIVASKNLLKDETWISLINEIPELQHRLLHNGSECLTVFFKNYTFKNVNELNALISKAQQLDFRLGKSDVAVSVRDYIEFLNTLGVNNRLTFLKSNHPLNKDVWEQIPNLALFKVSDYEKLFRTTNEQEKYEKEERKRLARRARKRALEAENNASILQEVITQPPSDHSEANVSRESNLNHQEPASEINPSEQRLDEYLKQHAMTLSLDEFFKMRGEFLSMKDFVRLNCEDLSFSDFKTFMRPFLEADDAVNMNRVLACFFNYFMRHPQILLEKHYGKHKKIFGIEYVSKKSKFLEKLTQSASGEVYENIVRLATIAVKRLEATNIAELDNATDVVSFKIKDSITGEEKITASYNLTSEYVITMLGSANTAGLPAVNYEGLLTSAEKMMAEKRVDRAAKEYCLALSLNLDLVRLNQTLTLITKHRIFDTYSAITSHVLTHLGNLYSDIQTGGSTSDEMISSITKSITIFSEIFDYTQRLNILDKKNHIQYGLLFDKLYQFTQTELRARCYNESDRKQLLHLWLSLLPNLNDAQKLKAFYFAIQLSLPNEKLTISHAVRNWVTEKPMHLNSDTEIQEQRLLLELFSDSPAELEKIRQSGGPFRQLYRQTFLNHLTLSIDNLTDFKNNLIYLINEKCPVIFNQHKEIFQEELRLFLFNTLMNKLNVNDEKSMISLYEKYLALGKQRNGYGERGYTEDENAVIATIVAKTKNPTVVFVLSGNENQLRYALSKNIRESINPSSITHNPEKFNRLLEEMTQLGNIKAVSDLIARGANVNHKMSQTSSPMLLALINKMGDSEESLINLSLLLSKISETTRNEIFKNILEHHNLSIILSVLDSFPKEKRTEKCIALFFNLLRNKNFPHLDRLVREKRNLISPELLMKILYQEVMNKDSLKTDFLLNLIQSYPTESGCTEKKLIDAFLKSCDVHNELQMTHLHDFLHNRLSEDSLLANIMKRIRDETHNETVRFVLSNDEEKLRKLILVENPKSATLVAHEKTEKYNRLMREMAFAGNMGAVRRLTEIGARLNQTVNEKLNVHYPLIQVLITVASHKNIFSVEDFQYFMGKLSEKGCDALFDSLLIELKDFSRKKIEDDIYFNLLESCSKELREEKCNALLQHLLYRNCFDSAKKLIELKRTLVNTDVLIHFLQKSIDQNNEELTRNLLMILNLRPVLFSNIQRIKLDNMLSLLVCSPTENTKYAQLLYAIFEKLHLPKGQQACLIESQINNETQLYEYAANLFVNKYENKLSPDAIGRLPKRESMQSAKDWLIEIFYSAIAINRTPHLEYDKIKTLIQTLEELGWIHKAPDLTLFSRASAHITLTNKAPITRADITLITDKVTHESTERVASEQQARDIRNLHRLFAETTIPTGPIKPKEFNSKVSMFC